MTTRDNDDSSGARVIAEVGGIVDETRVTLGIYGHDLDPAEISTVLGCSATSAHHRGDIRGQGPPYTQGAWLLTVEGQSPFGPDALVQGLLSRLPREPIVWEQLAAKYTIKLSFGLFISTWNRGFELSPTTVQELGALRVRVGFSIYSDEASPFAGPA